MTAPIAIVLAAGKGTRMKSDRPKVLCEALGRPLVHYVLDALAHTAIGRTIVVVGYQADAVRQALSARPNVEFVEQTEQLGTGHAVQMCSEKLSGHDGAVLVLAGDSPLVQSDSIQKLLDEFHRTRPACVLGTLHKQNPTGLGRIVRGEDGSFEGIIEEKDANESQRRITEVNMSTYVFDARALLDVLQQLRNDNKAGEFYLTDCPGMLKAKGRLVRALPVLQPCEALSVNTLEELRVVEQQMRRRGYAAEP